MSKNIAELPFTEIVERTVQIARIGDTNDRSRVRGAINDGYVRELPYLEDWTFFLASSAITTTPQFTTGTVSINTLQTAASFSTDVLMDATFTGRKIAFNSNANVYDLTFVNASSATISPPLSGNNNIVSGAYTIFSPTYTLAPNFQRFPKNGGLQMFQGGRITIISEEVIQGYYRTYTPSPSLPKNCRVLAPGTDGIPRVEIQPPPRDPMVMPYDYLIQPKPMAETTAGVITVTAGATAVTGSAGTTRFTEANTGWYLRVDALGKGADSTWYKIASIANDSSLTLSTAFANTTMALANYTLSSAPEAPALLHPFILWNGVRQLLEDQDDPMMQQVEIQMKHDIKQAKRLYKTRIYNQEVDTVLTEWQFRR